MSFFGGNIAFGLHAMSLKVRRRFVAAGVNRVVNVLDWGDDGRIAYGAHHFVAVYDPQASLHQCHGC